MQSGYLLPLKSAAARATASLTSIKFGACGIVLVVTKYVTPDEGISSCAAPAMIPCTPTAQTETNPASLRPHAAYAMVRPEKMMSSASTGVRPRQRPGSDKQ